jgi:sulfonate transport system substrate-binding protein
MSLNIFWFLPTHGDGHYLGTSEVVEAQQKIADTFADLKLIPKRLSIKDVVWTPPTKVARQ